MTAIIRPLKNNTFHPIKYRYTNYYSLKKMVPVKQRQRQTELYM